MQHPEGYKVDPAPTLFGKDIRGFTKITVPVGVFEKMAAEYPQDLNGYKEGLEIRRLLLRDLMMKEPDITEYTYYFGSIIGEEEEAYFMDELLPAILNALETSEEHIDIVVEMPRRLREAVEYYITFALRKEEPFQFTYGLLGTGLEDTSEVLLNKYLIEQE